MEQAVEQTQEHLGPKNQDFDCRYEGADEHQPISGTCRDQNKTKINGLVVGAKLVLAHQTWCFVL